MRSEKVLRLGKVSIDGDLIAFEPEGQLAFEADRRDIILVGVAYDYREASEDREKTHIRLTARIDGQNPESFEAIIGDSPALDDSRRGFLSLPIRAPGSGAHKGTFLVETRYESGEWRAHAELETRGEHRAEGTFTLHVR